MRVVLLAGCLLLGACGDPPDMACNSGLSSTQCTAFCAQRTTCAECAAQPSCGWCGAAGSSGATGECVPALRGEDRRNLRPDARCSAEWFYRTADTEVQSGTAPFCPAIPVPEQTPTEGGEQ